MNIFKRFWFWWFPKRGNYIGPSLHKIEHDYFEEHYEVLSKEDYRLGYRPNRPEADGFDQHDNPDWID